MSKGKVVYVCIRESGEKQYEFIVCHVIGVKEERS